MERLRIAAPVLFIAVGTCLLCLGVRSATGMHYETRVDLPRAVTGETIRGRDWIEIHLARDGALSMTLNELVQRASERPQSAILVCADARAPLLNVYYVFGVVYELDAKREVYLAVRGRASRGAIRVRPDILLFEDVRVLVHAPGIGPQPPPVESCTFATVADQGFTESRRATTTRTTGSRSASIRRGASSTAAGT